MDSAEKLQIELGSLESILSSLGDKLVSFGMRLLAAMVIMLVGF
jgi:hypothetical protein